MDHEEYKRQTMYCHGQAQKAVSTEMKANWLQLASGWLSMVQPAADAAANEIIEVTALK